MARLVGAFNQPLRDIAALGVARPLDAQQLDRLSRGRWSSRRVEVPKQPSFERRTLQGASVAVAFAPPTFKRLAVDFILVDVADYPYHRLTCSSAHGFFMLTGRLQQIDERGSAPPSPPPTPHEHRGEMPRVPVIQQCPQVLLLARPLHAQMNLLANQSGPDGPPSSITIRTPSPPLRRHRTASESSIISAAHRRAARTCRRRAGRRPCARRYRRSPTPASIGTARRSCRPARSRHGEADPSA